MGTGRLKVAASVTLALGMLAAFGANYRVDEKGNVHSARTIAERVAIIAPVAPGVLRARPTFNSCGVCFGSVQAVEGLALEYQTKGDRQWKVCREFPHFDESGDYRGSLMRLREDTDYVCRIVVKGKEIVIGKRLPLWIVTDERFCDGFYFVSALKQLRILLADPSRMAEPLENLTEDTKVIDKHSFKK